MLTIKIRLAQSNIHLFQVPTLREVTIDVTDTIFMEFYF